MITDALMTFEEDMAMPATATTVTAATILDLQAAGVGGSGKLFAVGMITAPMAAGTSIQMSIWDGAADPPTVQIYAGEVIPEASALKGVVLGCFALPPDVKRFVSAKLTSVGTGATGTVSLYITNHPVKSL